MTITCPIKPLGESFIFEFTDDSASGSFITNTKSGIIMTNQDTSTQSIPRWGQVLAVGKDVTMFAPGDYVLIEPLMWTTYVKLHDRKYWKSDQSKVYAVTQDRETTYQL